MSWCWGRRPGTSKGRACWGAAGAPGVLGVGCSPCGTEGPPPRGSAGAAPGPGRCTRLVWRSSCRTAAGPLRGRSSLRPP
uniref:Putative secreted protein n=1 Tax=Ixodes ricinus TaxID=34613 RepID=A0A6B0TVW3_IXORI